MPNKTLVVVSDLDDSGRAEITVVDGAERASRLVETLLEAGCEKERIRVFTAEEMDMRVTHRPVVALTMGETEEEPPVEDQRDDEEESGEAEEESPVLAPEDGQPQPVLSAMPGPHAPGADGGPYTKDGVRFSSLFRPA
jgi:hypothetical protein